MNLFKRIVPSFSFTEFQGQKLADEKLILRHYPFLSWHHLLEKYTQRVYSEQEIRENGWHGRRANFDASNAWLPISDQLFNLKTDGWDTSAPRKSHPHLGGNWD